MGRLTFSEMFELQKQNQNKMLQKGLYDDFKNEETVNIPCDDVRLFSYHMQQLQSEIGEVLDADKRWKNFRNAKYHKEAKVEEIADCFIVLMNIAMFSGVDGDEMTAAIKRKLDIVSDRLED